MINPQKKLSVQLVERLREGDEEAFAALYEEYQLRIYEYLAGLVGKSDAYDLLQDTFIKMLTRIETLQDATKFTSWLYRIARNCAYDHLRRRYRYQALHVREEFETLEVPDDHMDIIECVIQKELVQQALSCLPLRLRDCLLLHAIEGLSPREIAPIIGVGENSAYTYLSMARRQFREMYLHIQQQSDITEREDEASDE